MKKFAIAIISIIILSGCNSSHLSEKEACFNRLTTLKEEHNVDFSSKNKLGYRSVSKIFYSPKEDSCLYILRTYSNATGVSGANGTTLEYELYDLLTSERLVNEKGCDGELYCGMSTTEAEKKFNSKVAEYE